MLAVIALFNRFLWSFWALLPSKGKTVYQIHKEPISLHYIHYIQLSVRFLHSAFLANGTLHCSMWMKNTFNKTPIQLLGCYVASASATGNFTRNTELTSAFSLSHLNCFMTSLRLIVKKMQFSLKSIFSHLSVHFYGQRHTVASLSFELLVSDGWIFVVSCRGNP